jgi:DNA modification methylase
MQLLHGDCLELLQNIPDKSIDMILTDPPYGTTACKWDSVIPFAPLWEQLNRIIKDNGAIVLFGSEPFSSALRMSNIKNYKYDWVWDKKLGTGFLNAKKQPLRRIENIIVFYKKQCCYYPIMRKGVKRFKGHKEYHSLDKIYGDFKATNKINNEYYPTSILEFSNADKTGKLHPTQKPVPLLEYLIKTYTLENETVLDFTMGSGSTGVACVNTNRDFIGIELDDKYFSIAKDRIEAAQKEVQNVIA